MSELLVTLLRLSYLVGLWLLVLFAIGVLRRDVLGTRLARPGSRQRPRPPSEAKRETPKTPAGPPAARAARPAPGTAQGPKPARLLVTDGGLRGRTHSLGTTPATIGRSPTCTLVLEDDYASGRHARVFPEDGGWWVEDLGSTNGTFVNGERISAPVELTQGMQVRIGQTVIELQR